MSSPAKPPVPPQLRLVGWLLVASALLGLATMAFLLLLDSDEDSSRILRDVSGTGRLAGRITNDQGDPLLGVNLTLIGTNLTTETDGNGEYRLEAVPAGQQNLTFRKPGYVTLHYHTIIVPEQGNRLATLQLKAGEGSQEQRDPRQRQLLDQSLSVCATLVFILVIFTGVGGYKSLQGRDYTWVVGGALMGLFTFGFLLGSLLSLAALILALKYRRLYREEDWPPPPPPPAESAPP